MGKRLVLASLMTASVLMLGACDAVVYNIPSQVTAARAEVHQDHVSTAMDAAAMTPAAIQQLARDYRRFGDSQMLLTLTYDPQSPTNTAGKAATRAAELGEMLRKQGVRNIHADTMPVRASGAGSQAIITYGALRAVPPTGCPRAVDMDIVADISLAEDYRLGCSIETYTARQIARPADLLGNDIMDTGLGRYHANSIDLHTSGQVNPPLDGESASGD